MAFPAVTSRGPSLPPSWLRVAQESLLVGRGSSTGAADATATEAKEPERDTHTPLSASAAKEDMDAVAKRKPISQCAHNTMMPLQALDLPNAAVFRLLCSVSHDCCVFFLPAMMVLEVNSLGSQLVLYGVLSSGLTARVSVEGFYPLIYVRLPQVADAAAPGGKRDISEGELGAFKAVLEAELQSTRAAKTLAQQTAAAASSSSSGASSAAATPKKGAMPASSSSSKLAVPTAAGGKGKLGSKRSPSPSPSSRNSSAAASSASSSKAIIDLEEEGDEEGEGAEAGEFEEAAEEEEEEADEDEEALANAGGKCVMGLSIIRAQSLMFYRGDGKDPFLAIYLSSPTLCTPAQQLLTKPKIGKGGTAGAAPTTTAPPSLKQIACATCTLNNPTTANVCSACESPLDPSSAVSASSSSSSSLSPPPSSSSSSPTSFILFGEVYAANIEHYLRFMVAANIVGGGWCEVRQYEAVTEESRRQSNCNIELRCKWTGGQHHPSSPIIAGSAAAASDTRPLRGLAQSLDDISSAAVAPLRALSFDIQTSIRAGFTPDASQDPILSIANTVMWFGGSAKEGGKELPPLRVLFLVRSAVHPSVVAESRHHPQFMLQFCSSEAELLVRWRRFLLEVDPDVLTGFDVAEHDLPYIMQRVEKYEREEEAGGHGHASKRSKKSPAAASASPMPASPAASLSSTSFAHWRCLGRDGRTPSALQNIQTYTAAWVKSKRRMTATSNQASAYFKCEGRCFFDILRVVQTTHSLRTYSLQEVSASFHYSSRRGETNEDGTTVT